MTEDVVVNTAALEPLFAPWEEPIKHRVKADKPGQPAKVVNGRRPSSITIAQNLRGSVREWREAFYAGASYTSMYLLNDLFNRSHRKSTDEGE